MWDAGAPEGKEGVPGGGSQARGMGTEEDWEGLPHQVRGTAWDRLGGQEG